MILAHIIGKKLLANGRMRSTPSGGSRKREYSFAGRFRPPAKHHLSHSATGRIASGLPAALARVLGGSWISMCSRWSLTTLLRKNARAMIETASRMRRWFARIARASGRVAAARDPRAHVPGQSMICCPVTQTLEPPLYPLEGRQAGRIAAEIGIAH